MHWPREFPINLMLRSGTRPDRRLLLEGTICLFLDALNNEEQEQNTGYNSSARRIVNREDQAGITRKVTVGASVWFGLVCVTDEPAAYGDDVWRYDCRAHGPSR